MLLLTESLPGSKTRLRWLLLVVATPSSRVSLKPVPPQSYVSSLLPRLLALGSESTLLLSRGLPPGSKAMLLVAVAVADAVSRAHRKRTAVAAVVAGVVAGVVAVVARQGDSGLVVGSVAA
jgi:hypothetical protein